MGLKCRIITDKTGTATAYNEDGSVSSLYEALKTRFGNQDDALNYWAISQTEEFKKDFPIATVDNVITFVNNTNSLTESLSREEIEAVRSTMANTGYSRLSDLYNDLVAIFKANPSSTTINSQLALESGLYTREELDTIDLSEVDQAITLMEGTLRHYDVVTEVDSTLEDSFIDTSSKTLIGTYQRVSQEAVDDAVNQLADLTQDPVEFMSALAELPFTDYYQRLVDNVEEREEVLSRLRELKVVPQIHFDGQTLSSEDMTTEVTIRNTVPQVQDTTSIRAKVLFLSDMSPIGWLETESVKKFLDQIEDELIDYNVDLVGLSNLVDNPMAVIELLDAAEAMLSEPSTENIKEFARLKNEHLPTEALKRVEKLPAEYDGYNIVSLYTSKSDSELFAQGLIKVGDNLYHKVQLGDRNEVYEYLYQRYIKGQLNVPQQFRLTENHTDPLNKESVLSDLSRYVNTRETGLEVADNELLSLYQLAFNHLPIPGNTKIQNASKASAAETSVDYIKNEFVPELYNLKLREKKKNSTLYRDVLSKLEITDKDIVMVAPIRSIKGMPLEDDFKEYIRLTKDSAMDYLLGTDVSTSLQDDIFAINNPETIREYTGVYQESENFIVTPESTSEIIKVNNVPTQDPYLYKKVMTMDGKDLFVRFNAFKGSVYSSNNTNFESDLTEGKDLLKSTVFPAPTRPNEAQAFKDAKFENKIIVNYQIQDGETRSRDGWDPSRGNQTLEGAPLIKGATGADPSLTAVAEDYARAKGINYRRQSKYVEVDVDRAKRIAQAYDEMEHNPTDPVVKEAYQNLINQTVEQYRFLEAAGYKFYLFDESNDPYDGNPWNAMRDLRGNKVMGSFATEAGFGTGNEGLDVSNNPLLQDTGIRWPYGSLDGPLKRVLANDLFRAVHDAFGHGLEGAGFRARGEENAWQAHARLFTGSALAAITSETRGQNSWLNFGKYGEQNQTAKVEDTVFAPQKTGIMPDWTWKEGF
jgi:hypothetical protein